MLLLITYIRNFNEQCVVLVIFIVFFPIILLKCNFTFAESNNKNVGL